MQRVRLSSHQSPVQKLGQTQMSLTPKFKLAFATPSQPNYLPLIPGLPDDIALNCLLRLPVDSHPVFRLVCRRWHHLFAHKDQFFAERKALGFHEPYLFTFAFHRCTGKIRWLVLDLTRLSWHAIPSMPCRAKSCPHGFGCVAIPLDATLMVCGGMVSDLDCPLHFVLKYEVLRNKWTVTTRMNTPRSFFAGGLIDGRVYVAGGYSGDHYELNSAEVFDPVSGIWQPIARMGANMACYDSAVLNGKLYVTEGWLWPFLASPIGQVYDPRTDSWENMAVGMREGWTGPSAVVDGKVFVVSEREGMRVKVYDVESDSWDDVTSSPVPKRIRKPFVVSSSGRRIYVVGVGLCVAIGHVERAEGSGLDGNGAKVRFLIRWQEADAPSSREVWDLTPSSTQVLFA